jgi:Tfp pilus assembly protein PilV
MARLSAMQESGFAMIELVVSAALLIIIVTGTFSAFDQASATSGSIKSRATGAGVAQQDQERLRAFKAVDLSNYRETRTQMVTGVPYTVVSRADWVDDQSGTTSCATNGTATADYLHITSTVTWPRMGPVKPVQLDSLLAPPAGSFSTSEGTLIVSAQNPAGQPVSGVPITAAGPENLSDTTNSLGCVVWGFVTAGNYTVTLASSCINHQGNSPPTVQASVVGSATATVALECGAAAGLNATFDTKPLNGAVVASKARYVSIGNSGLDAPGIRSFGPGTPQTSIAATSVYPFTSPYSVYSGNCVGADQARYPTATPGNPDYRTLTTLTGGQNPTVNLRQPAINLVVNNSSNLPLAAARVRATATAQGCGGIVDLGPTNASGKPPDPGLPYGTYNLCADSGGKMVTLNNVANDNPNGTTQLTMKPSAGVTGTCP